jgi:endonuclease-3
MTLKEKRKEILHRLEKIYGGMNTALSFESPFQLLISTLLAAQSNDNQVNKVMIPFYKDFPDAKTIAQLPLDYITDRISSIGLYRNKAKYMLATAKIITEKYFGNVPTSKKDLMALPGVGVKTANVVVSISFGQPAIAVDTHVFRVSNRLNLANAGNVTKTEEQLMRNIPRDLWSDAHHWLIWHGRKLCKAQRPDCSNCFLIDLCKFGTNIK